MRKVLILSASFLFLLQACKKDGALVPEFQDNTTFSFFSDTTSIQTSTRRSDSTLADQIAIGLVGEYRDSAFGYSRSSLHIQPLLSSNALVFNNSGETTKVDSVILSLEYSGIFGDTSIAQTFNVFRIDETLSADELYFSNADIAVQATPLATHSFIPNLTEVGEVYQPNNFGTVDTVTPNPQLRINLGNALGEEIISKQGSTELADDLSFADFFKGLQITPVFNPNISNNEAAILYFRLTATDTKMTIYCTTSSSTDTVQKAINFPIKTSSVRFNTFEHDYAGSAAEAAIQNSNTNYAYVEAMAGVETTIKFPTLKERLGGKILVNRAELIIPAANGSYANNVGKAEKLIVAARDEFGALQFIPDALINAEFFGGDFSRTNNEYKFNISRYIQSYLNGNQNDNGLTLLVTGSAVKAERVVILNENNSNNRIRLNLYYTNIQE